MSREGKWTKERRKVNEQRSKLRNDLESAKSAHKSNVLNAVRRHQEEVNKIWVEEDRTFEDNLKKILDIFPPTIMTDPFPVAEDERKLIKECRKLRLEHRARKEKQIREERIRVRNQQEMQLNR